MLDVARHFMPKDGVLRYLDLLAAHKLNVLHLHLTDDQGWRIEIKRYPRLTEVGAWRARTKYGHRASELWDETPHGGFYTQDDIREIVAYAAERHITVVPEIDIPGHSQAAIAAYPELGNTDVIDTAALAVWDTWGVNPNVLAPTDNTLRFYEGVLEEVLDLFPAETSPFIHIGGDECPKDQWKASPAAQARIAELGSGRRGRAPVLVHPALRRLAHRPRAPAHRLGRDPGGRPRRGAAVSSWRGYAGGDRARPRPGTTSSCAPSSRCTWTTVRTAAPTSRCPSATSAPWRTSTASSRCRRACPRRRPRHILGAQANVWTEVMQNRARVDYQVFPRLAAFAEVAWSRAPGPGTSGTSPTSSARMTAHYARLDALGVDYRPPGGPLPWQRRPGVLGRPIEGAPPDV